MITPYLFWLLKGQTLFVLHLVDRYDINSNLLHPSNTLMWLMSIECFTLLADLFRLKSDWHAELTPANVNVIWDVITAGESNYVMLRWFIWENVEVDCIISPFSFSNYGLIAVQFFNSILLVYHKTLKGQLQRFQKLISNDRIWPSEHGFEVIFEKSLFVFKISAFKVRNKHGIHSRFHSFSENNNRETFVCDVTSDQSSMISTERSDLRDRKAAKFNGFWKKLWFTVLLMTA